uniref:Ninein-like protein n=1 Tax=Marsilea vestita TaxID=59764 RepID=I6XPG9_MARVE|nr:ninein-like protein [Marsilea vestita]AFN42831.1 ninein-like protein [Marsilea vestita]
MDCHLREQEVRAQLYDLQVALHNVQNAKVDSRKLVALLPALREWLQVVKRIPYDQVSHSSHDPYDRSPRYPPMPMDNIVMSVTKEIQGLQKSLTKLASKHSREAIFDLKKMEVVKAERSAY